jgi:hypothetical protein
LVGGGSGSGNGSGLGFQGKKRKREIGFSSSTASTNDSLSALLNCDPDQKELEKEEEQQQQQRQQQQEQQQQQQQLSSRNNNNYDDPILEREASESDGGLSNANTQIHSSVVGINDGRHNISSSGSSSDVDHLVSTPLMESMVNSELSLLNNREPTSGNKFNNCDNNNDDNRKFKRQCSNSFQKTGINLDVSSSTSSNHDDGLTEISYQTNKETTNFEESDNLPGSSSPTTSNTTSIVSPENECENTTAPFKSSQALGNRPVNPGIMMNVP